MVYSVLKTVSRVQGDVFQGAIDGLQRPRMVYSVHALFYRELAMVYKVSELV